MGSTRHDTAQRDHESEEDKQVLRRSSRNIQRPAHLGDYDCTSVL